jgi:hypothetical protein
VRKNYQRKERKSNHKFEVMRGQELLVRVAVQSAKIEIRGEGRGASRRAAGVAVTALRSLRAWQRAPGDGE